MPSEFPYDVFLSHSVKDKAVVRPLAERMRHDGLMVWFDEWELPVTASRQSAAFSAEAQMREEEEGGALPRRRYAEKIEEWLEHYRPTLQPSAFSLCFVRSARTGRSWRPARVGGTTCPFATR